MPAKSSGSTEALLPLARTGDRQADTVEQKGYGDNPDHEKDRRGDFRLPQLGSLDVVDGKGRGVPRHPKHDAVLRDADGSPLDDSLVRKVDSKRTC